MSGIKRLVPVCLCLLISLMLLTSCAFAETVRYEGDGFQSAEDAAACYLDGLKNLDVQQMLQAFAWETQASHYSFEAYYARTGNYSASVMPRIPSYNDLLASLNLEALRAAQIQLIYRSIETYILPEGYQPGGFVSFQDRDDPVGNDPFFKGLNIDRIEALSGMDNIRFFSPDNVTGGKFSLEPNQRNYAMRNAVYGADEVTDIVAAAAVGDGTLLFIPTAARYGDRWFLVSVSSVTSDILGIDLYSKGFVFGDFSEDDLPK